MRNTKWMVLCLFIGFLLAAGMMSTVPIYMDASLQRILIKDMQQYQEDTGLYPGEYVVNTSMQMKSTYDERLATVQTLTTLVDQRTAAIDIPRANSKTMLMDEYVYVFGPTNTRIKMMGMSSIEEHINIIEGRMYNAGKAADGSYEVICNAECMKILGIVCGNTYEIQNSFFSKTEPLTVTVVGVFEQSSENDSYWSETMEEYLNALMMDYDTFLNDYLATGVTMLSDITSRYSFDYQEMDLNALSSVTKQIEQDFELYPAYGFKFKMGIYDILTEYAVRAENLKSMLWILQIPSIVMLAFYLFMVSQLNVEQEKNEIAVFKSRGASSKQIFGIYAMEAGVLGLATLIFAPLIGLCLCSFLGVSNGFLEFVNRTGLAAKLSLDAFIYAFIAIAVFFITTMIPIIPASKLSIVKYKQSKAKVVKMALWEKICVDVLLLGGSLVWYYLTVKKLDEQFTDGTFVSDGSINPMYFVFSTMFIIGGGLLFIRLYPYLLKLIYHVGKRFWSVSQYVAITAVARSQGGRERFLMLFLCLTFGLGIFSANTARAINNSKSDRIYYSTGTDVVLDVFWQLQSVEDETSYVEPDFARYEELDGVETATKVLRVDASTALGSIKSKAESTLMCIEPGKFSKTAWFRDDLLPVHWWNYCNALVECKTGVLASRSWEEKGVQLGDNITVKWSGNDAVTLTVVAFVDYWPGIDPSEQVVINQRSGETAIKDFLVCNYNHIRKVTEFQPYQVWLNLKDDATSEQLYADIEEKHIKIQHITDSSQLLIEEKTDPELQGMNGALTLGFVVIMLMTVIGFLIYWIISIRSRTLQFGVLRAMGVTFGEIIGTLGYEQLLVSVASIASGFVLGGIASDLFVPLFRTMYDANNQIPPFIVTGDGGDYIKMYVIIAIMLLGGFTILGGIIRKININKALKLGED
ncbi:MAG: ABC transporter permease [Oscillospiraceae bacterium]|nr:ABC transporter permease [Oscillospiraceae bacterium]